MVVGPAVAALGLILQISGLRLGDFVVGSYVINIWFVLVLVAILWAQFLVWQDLRKEWEGVAPPPKFVPTNVVSVDGVRLSLSSRTEGGEIQRVICRVHISRHHTSEAQHPLANIFYYPKDFANSPWPLPRGKYRVDWDVQLQGGSAVASDVIRIPRRLPDTGIGFPGPA
jgi:hypothetical protein